MSELEQRIAELETRIKAVIDALPESMVEWLATAEAEGNRANLRHIYRDGLRIHITPLIDALNSQIQSLQQALAEANARAEVETGWLIERFAEGFMPAWIGLDTDDAPYIFRFLEDSNKALRFARKIDAEHAMRQFEHLWRSCLYNDKRCTVVATEHSWHPTAIEKQMANQEGEEVGS